MNDIPETSSLSGLSGLPSPSNFSDSPDPTGSSKHFPPPTDTDTLSDLRTKIDAIDAQILNLFAQRTGLAAKIGVCKRQRSLPVLDQERENQKIAMAEASVPEYLKPSVAPLMRILMDAAKSRQRSTS